MSDADDSSEDDEREAIRERKREQLRQEVEGGTEPSGDRETPSDPVHVESAEHFDELVADNDIVLVDYYADWCGPCKMLEPVVESIAGDTDALVAKVDIDDLQGLAQDAGVRGVPTLVVYADGSPVERLVGMQEESRLRSVLENAGA